jgi:hypothetical protein
MAAEENPQIAQWKAQFEKWAVDHDFDLVRHADGTYATQDCYDAWQGFLGAMQLVAASNTHLLEAAVDAATDMLEYYGLSEEDYRQILRKLLSARIAQLTEGKR